MKQIPILADFLESGVPETQVSRQRVVQRGRTKLGRASAVHVTPDKIQDESKVVKLEKAHECSCCGSRVLQDCGNAPNIYLCMWMSDVPLLNRASTAFVA